MNKELLNENLNQILEGLKTAIDTANAELPAILEEIVRWGMFKYSAFSLISLVCLLLSVWTTIFFIKNHEEPDAIAGTVLISLFLLIPFTYNLFKLLFVFITPKLYIINYLKDLI
jgi:hypothetical protein